MNSRACTDVSLGDGPRSGTEHRTSPGIVVVLRFASVGGDGTLVNSQLYADIEHGFTLDLPGGHYDIEVTDAAHNVIAAYDDVIVDGDVTLQTPTALARWQRPSLARAAPARRRCARLQTTRLLSRAYETIGIP